MRLGGRVIWCGHPEPEIGAVTRTPCLLRWWRGPRRPPERPRRIGLLRQDEMKQAVDHPAQYGHHQAPLGLQTCVLIELAQCSLLPSNAGIDRQLDHSGTFASQW